MALSKASSVGISILSYMCNDPAKELVAIWLAIQGINHTGRSWIVLWATVSIIDVAVEKDRKFLQPCVATLIGSPPDATKIQELVRIATFTGAV